MNSLIIYLTLLLCTLNFQIHCSYPLTTEGDNIPIPPRLSFTSTVVYNDIIYSYGGISQFTGSKGTDKMFSYTMNSLTGEMVVRLEDEGHGPICSSCSAVLFPDSTEILVFSRPNYNETSVFFHNQTMWQPHQILLPHFYDLVKRSWRVAPPPQMIGQEDTFYFRNFPTTVMNGNDGVYILGGYNTSHTYMRNGFYYNRNDNSYTTISLPNNDSYVSAIGYIGL
jgi:hypothetical protein